MYYIGIDLGTSSVKLILTDKNGNISRSVTEDYPVSHPRDGWSEQNPSDWFLRILAGLRRLLQGAETDRVRGIGIAGQMHGLVILDRDDQVIRPAILWNDGRSAAQTDYLNSEIGADALAAFTGNIAFPGFTAPKLLWLRENEPENFKKIAKLMLPKDYIVYMLTGAFATDVSDASGTLLMDVKRRRWSEEMLRICGIGGEILPAIHESPDPVGTLKREFADRLGLRGEVIVAAGAGDNAAAALGMGVCLEGECNISLGTSGTVFIPAGKFPEISNHAIHAFADAAQGYHLMGCMLSAAACAKWWVEDVLQTPDYAVEESGIDGLGRNRVFFLPYLMGERSPHNDADARGMFIGMSLSTTRKEMTQAVLEGVAFGLRDSLEAARAAGLVIPKASLCGGGAKSPLWQGIIANALGLEIEVPEDEKGPAFGAAILAMAACGEYDSPVSASKAVAPKKRSVKPDPVLAALYDERYAQYATLYPGVAALYPGLKK